MTIPQAGELLGKTARQMEWLIYTGQAPRSAKIGGRRMFRESDIENWVNEQFEKESA
nr:helix-turn-helix domain-containing protein [Brachybacterium fresconis]